MMYKYNKQLNNNKKVRLPQNGERFGLWKSMKMLRIRKQNIQQVRFMLVYTGKMVKILWEAQNHITDGLRDADCGRFCLFI